MSTKLKLYRTTVTKTISVFVMAKNTKAAKAVVTADADIVDDFYDAPEAVSNVVLVTPTTKLAPTEKDRYPWFPGVVDEADVKDIDSMPIKDVLKKLYPSKKAKK